MVLSLCGSNSRVECSGIVAIHVRDHLPAIGIETHRRVIAKPALDLAVDGNAVVVVKRDQFAESKRSGQSTYFMRNAFHETAVAKENIGIVVDHVVAINVECPRKFALRDRHADGISEPLPQRPCRGFNSWRHTDFRMARRL